MQEKTVIVRDEENPSFTRAIRKYCLNCGEGTTNDVRDCNITRCELFPYRFGCKPKSAIHKLQKTYTVKVIR